MTFAAAVLLAGAVLILDSATSRVVIAYIIIVALVGGITASTTAHAPLALALLAVSFFLKLVVAPVGVWQLARRNAPARSLRPAIGLPLRLVVVLLLSFGSHEVGRLPALAAIPLIDLVTYIIFCGLAVLVIDRNLLAQVIGLLVLSTGVTLAGAVCAPQLPEVVELGATFDTLVATFIGLALVRAFLTYNPLLDIESLRSLRG